MVILMQRMACRGLSRYGSVHEVCTWDMYMGMCMTYALELCMAGMEHSMCMHHANTKLLRLLGFPCKRSYRICC